MSKNRDRLEGVVGPLRAEQELNYPALGASIVGIAYQNNTVRQLHGLKVAPPLEKHRGVAWQRENRSFVLLEHIPGESYQLNQWNLGVRPEEDQLGVVLAKAYVFGTSKVAPDGLALVVLARGGDDFTTKRFLRDAWREGRITDDLSRIRRKLPTESEKVGFRRSIFSVLERVPKAKR